MVDEQTEEEEYEQFHRGHPAKIKKSCDQQLYFAHFLLFNSLGANALWGAVKKNGALRQRVACRLIEEKRSGFEQNTLRIKNFKYGSSFSIFVQKNNEAQRSQVSQLLTLTNNTTAEFDSGISYRDIEGRNTV